MSDTAAVVPELLTEREVERLTKVSAAALKQARHRGTGLPYTRIGRRIRYRSDDVLAYLSANTVVPEGN